MNPWFIMVDSMFNGNPGLSATVLSGLATFLVVARALNFARAAEELGVTPTAVSKTIKLLERELGVRLLNRTTRSVALSDAGAELLSVVAPAFQDVGASLEQVRSSAHNPQGELRINASHVAFATLIEHELYNFSRLYPQLAIQFSINNSLVDMVGEGFDAGVRLGHTLQSDMVAIQISGYQQRVLVASPDYIARCGAPKTPQELLSHNCIRQRMNINGKLYEWVFQDEGRALTIDVAGQLIFDEMRAALNAAVAGIGIAYVFKDFAREELLSGSVVSLLEEWSPITDPFYLYYPQAKHMPAKLRVFIDYFRGKVVGAQCVK
jgi:DNA-binding transcriptional LysR family regulator